jgi:hypothetical protein
MRKHHRRAYVGLSKAPFAGKSLRESLNTHVEKVQLVRSQRVARDGVVQESITREREFGERRGGFG